MARTSTNVAPTSTADWRVLAAAGAPGATGPQGLTGPQGPTGSQGPAGSSTFVDDRFGQNSGQAREGRSRAHSRVASGLIANGQTLSVSSNQALFALYGTTYGGNGATTFQLPNLTSVTPNGMTYYVCSVGVFPSSN